VLDIQDCGHGLRDDLKKQNDPLVETFGVGIQGMRERIRQFAGTFDVEFTDKGTTVRVTVPLGTTASEASGESRLTICGEPRIVAMDWPLLCHSRPSLRSRRHTCARRAAVAHHLVR
jgi:hypothetical protein